MVPVWFHVVPTVSTFSQTFVFPRKNLHCQRGSCVVPCGSYCGSTTQTFVFPRETLTAGVVPVWFHVVPTLLSKTFTAGVVCSVVRFGRHASAEARNVPQKTEHTQQYSCAFLPLKAPAGNYY